MTTAADKRYDVLIGGGGMIGTSLALALEPLGLDIAVIEAVPRDREQQPSFDDRSTALSRSTRRMFDAMGLWPAVAAAATPIRRIHVSDRGRFGFAHIDAAEQGVEALGHVVVNRVLGEVLEDARAAAKGVDFFCPARIVDVVSGDDRLKIGMEQPDGRVTTLETRLLAAADGAKSTIRELVGVGARQSRYGQHALIGNLRPEQPHDGVAYERFTERGPLALLPFGDERVAFVWTVRETEARDLLELDDATFLECLQAEFGFRLGALSAIGKRAAYPLYLSKALRVTAARTVLVGNAAHGLHPVAAQGFNLGMRDVAALCDCLADAAGQDGNAAIGSSDMLARYARWRRDDQDTLVRLTDGLVRLFGSDLAPVRALRDAGMLAFDLIPGLRRAFARRMMGLTGRLPRLARGLPLR